MGLILDTSLIVGQERRRFDLKAFLQTQPDETPYLTTITVSELLHGVERADSEARARQRSVSIEKLLQNITILPFDLAQARCHARIWAHLERAGEMIGPYDLLIAAAGIAADHTVATLNPGEFRRVPDLNVIDASPFRVDR